MKRCNRVSVCYGNTERSHDNKRLGLFSIIILPHYLHSIVHFYRANCIIHKPQDIVFRPAMDIVADEEDVGVG